MQSHEVLWLPIQLNMSRKHVYPLSFVTLVTISAVCWWSLSVYCAPSEAMKTTMSDAKKKPSAKALLKQARDCIQAEVRSLCFGATVTNMADLCRTGRVGLRHARSYL